MRAVNTAEGQHRYRAARVALAGLLVGVLASGNVFAQVPLRLTPSITLNAGKPRLAVLVVGMDQAAFAQTARLAYFAEQAAVRSDRFDVVKLTEALDPENARARQSRLAEAEDTMKAGQKAYDDLDTLKALQHYEKAVKLYEQTDLTKNFPGLVQAWLMKVASMIANGENKAAEAELDRVIPLDPRAQLSSNYFTPDSIAYAEKVKKNANNNANNTIDVKTAPVNAQVYVDGRFQGIAPLKVSGLTPAEHYVTVIAPGFSLGQQRARSGAVDFDLRKADGYPRYQAAADKVKLDADGPQRDQAAQEFGRFLGVDQVLLTVLKKSTTGERVEVTALRIEVKDGHNHSYKTGVLQLDDGLAQSADTFYSGLSGSDDPRKGGPVTHFAGGGGGNKKTIGYALLGAGGALVLGGLYFGISASNQANQFRALPQTHPAAASTASTGRTYALLADIFVIAGLASAGTGAYFAFAGGKGGGGESVEPVPDKKPVKKKAAPADDDLRDAEKRKGDEEKRKKAEAEAKEAEERAAKLAEQQKAAEEEAKRAEEEAAKSKKGKKLSKKEQAEEAKRLEEEQKRADEAAKKADEERKKAEEEAAKKKAEAEALRKAEEEAARKRKEAEEKKKKAEEDDLRNY